MTDDAPQYALVIFTPSGKRGRVARGTRVLQAARDLGVDLDSVCGGRGVCSKCQVVPGLGDFPKHGLHVTEDALSPLNAVEARYDEKRGLIAGGRLGCQATIEGDVVIDVPPGSQVHKQVVRKRAEVRDITLDPVLSLEFVDVSEPNGAALLSALRAQTGEAWLELDEGLDLSALEAGDEVTAAIHNDGTPVVVALWPGFYEGPLFGLAVDLGSTTIAGHLTNLATGEVVASSGLMNPQIRFGEDLMSRVSYSMMNEGGAEDMTRVVREGINSLVADLVKEARVDRAAVLDSVFVMNPVMHHLFLGLDPYGLGQAPFELLREKAQRLTARDLELDIAPGTRAYVLPLIAGHVGADAAAVALSEAPHRSDDLALIVDVGTNAEILLGDKTGVLACSSPTGPAFEGAQISSGQRAAPGAIERVEIDPATKEPRFRVIGLDMWSDEPDFATHVAATGITGICGSGIIEVIAEMRMAGIVDASGLIGSAEAVGTARCIADGRTHAYVLWEDAERRITVTNADVRAIQMAKAALYAGAKLLMDQRGVAEVDRVVLAGAFGAHISAKHAMVLGLIPDCPLDKVTSAGNAAGTGARIALLNKGARAEIETLVDEITHVETALEPRFQEHFVAATALPNSADPFPLLRGVVDLPEVSFGASETRRRRRR